jgi:hypothetical protein
MSMSELGFVIVVASGNGLAEIIWGERAKNTVRASWLGYFCSFGVVAATVAAWIMLTMLSLGYEGFSGPWVWWF